MILNLTLALLIIGTANAPGLTPYPGGGVPGAGAGALSPDTGILDELDLSTRDITCVDFDDIPTINDTGHESGIVQLGHGDAAIRVPVRPYVEANKVELADLPDTCTGIIISLAAAAAMRSGKVKVRSGIAVFTPMQLVEGTNAAGAKVRYAPGLLLHADLTETAFG